MLTLGMDVGSTTSKCVILQDGAELVAQSLIVAGIGTDGPERVLRDILKKAQLKETDIDYIAVTGYGRNTYQNADCQVSELTCHAMGAVHIFPDVKTIIDIGGQDAKVISIGKNGRMESFLMNDKCAAGTGRFLDVMAAILQLKVSDLETQAALADTPAKISSTCTVFAESEVISQLAAGAGIPNVVAGICQSVAMRTAALAKRLGVKEQVCMSGGVAQNQGVRSALEKELNVKIAYSPMAQMFGALGAAIYAKEQYEKDGMKSRR